MKRTGSRKDRSSDTVQCLVHHQQLANMANAAQGNGQNPGNAPRLWTPPLQALGTVAGMPSLSPAMPLLPLNQPPQWRQRRPGSTASMPMYTAPLPASIGQVPPAAPGTTWSGA